MLADDVSTNMQDNCTDRANNIDQLYDVPELLEVLHAFMADLEYFSNYEPHSYRVDEVVTGHPQHWVATQVYKQPVEVHEY